MARKNWIGLFFLVFGFGFLMQQANILDFSHILSIWWPLIFIIIGVVQLFNRTYSTMISGFLFILIGGFFLVKQWVDINLTEYLWPLILIVIGFVFIFSRVNHKKTPVDSKNKIHHFLLFSGTEVRSQSQSFEGGSVTAIFGGAEIDLRDATIADTGASLDLTTIFGGVNLYIPENVQVEVKGIPILGGWEDKTKKRGDDHTGFPVLTVNYLAVFGGVEIID
ncbi:DUF5668 domain-containing protein [Lentibacillus sp. N15]|uniref:LiaF transmembrane domain-containing protein n=1 Tax=Lentibacillus songyuanensis TaxID=3136161 RepID=UPI0031B9E106